MKKLSVVVPLYNKERYIDRCIQSLLNQDLLPSQYEIIIVDDGSTDAGSSIALKYAEEYLNIHLFHQKNQGAGAARNKGLELAKADYIYFLDADDYIATNVLNCLLDLCELNKLEILGFNSRYASDGSFTNSLTQNFKDSSIQVMDGMTFIAEHGFRNEAWWYIIKKSFLMDIGIRFPVGRYMEDSIFTASVLLKANRISKVNFDIHRFVHVENSATTNRNPNHLLKFIDDLFYAIKNFDILIKSLDISNENYNKVANVYKAKQQSFVFTIFIKAFRCPLLNYNDLKKILIDLNELEVYPIKRKIGGIGNKKTSRLYNLTYVPIFNSKILLYLSLKLKRLISSR